MRPSRSPAAQSLLTLSDTLTINCKLPTIKTVYLDLNPSNIQLLNLLISNVYNFNTFDIITTHNYTIHE